MAIDFVHDTQQIFRRLLDAMARPGQLQSLEELSHRIETPDGIAHAPFLLALTLLDAEVTFQIIGERSEDITKHYSSWTLSQSTTTENADYLFVQHDVEGATIADLFERAKKGTLVNPNESATFIIETTQLSEVPELVLSGPGISSQAPTTIAGSEAWLTARAKANEEFPLGIDVILVDHDNNLLCLPRTTVIQKAR